MPYPKSGEPQFTAAQEALYFTYATGMREKYSVACSTDLQSSPVYYPGADKLQITMFGGLLKERSETNYEACYFIFKINRSAWKDGSNMVIWIDEAKSADYFMFKGEDRLTATLIEPVNDPISGLKYYTAGVEDTLMLVTQNKANQRQSTVKFST